MLLVTDGITLLYRANKLLDDKLFVRYRTLTLDTLDTLDTDDECTLSTQGTLVGNLNSSLEPLATLHTP